MGVLKTADGVQFSIIHPGGFEILSALVAAAKYLGYNLTITAGTNGTHSGPQDPHYLGKAYDIRSRDIVDENTKKTALYIIMKNLGSTQEQNGGLVTEKFFGWLEDEGHPNEHFHIQVRHGVEYP